MHGAVATALPPHPALPGRSNRVKEDGNGAPWLHFYDPGTPHTRTYPDMTIEHFLDALSI